MKLDPLEEAAIEIVKENKKAKYLNAYYCRNIARMMVRKNKIGDDNWLVKELDLAGDALKAARKKAKSGGYAPYVQLTPQVAKYIVAAYGQEVFDALKALKDPEELFPHFAVHYCAAIKKIGIGALPDDPYQFVKESTVWKETMKSRRIYRAWKRRGGNLQEAASWALNNAAL